MFLVLDQLSFTSICFPIHCIRILPYSGAGPALCLGSSVHLYCIVLYVQYIQALSNELIHFHQNTPYISLYPQLFLSVSGASFYSCLKKSIVSSFLSPQNLQTITTHPALSLDQPTFAIAITKPNPLHKW